MTGAEVAESYEIKKERRESYPESFRRSHNVKKMMRREGSPSRVFRYVSLMPMWFFYTPKMKIQAEKPVAIEIRKGETLTFAENDTLRIYAAGETLEEAIKDFEEQLIHFFQHYSRLDWKKVTGEARKLKKLYEDLFQEAER